MHTIIVENECGCFKRSEFENHKSFSLKDDALLQARLMESHMNQKFCQKHFFTAVEEGDHFKIMVEMRPKAQSSGCCGGGHCS